jgi:hypothetical protein
MNDTITLDFEESFQVLDAFQEANVAYAGLKIDVEGGINEPDVLTILRNYKQDRTVEEKIAFAFSLTKGKRVVFRLPEKEQELFSFVAESPDLTVYFTKYPMLLQWLINLTDGILLKKLTMPLPT